MKSWAHEIVVEAEEKGLKKGLRRGRKERHEKGRKEGIKEGNERCVLAQDIFCQRVANYIAMYNNILNGADVIIFTAGLGENSIDTRINIAKRIASLGVKIDLERNKSIPILLPTTHVRGKTTLISTDDSKIPMYVIPTDEELMIALDTMEIITNR